MSISKGDFLGRTSLIVLPPEAARNFEIFGRNEVIVLKTKKNEIFTYFVIYTVLTGLHYTSPPMDGLVLKLGDRTWMLVCMP